jgi:hypothetical protein
MIKIRPEKTRIRNIRVRELIFVSQLRVSFSAASLRRRSMNHTKNVHRARAAPTIIIMDDGVSLTIFGNLQNTDEKLNYFTS